MIVRKLWNFSINTPIKKRFGNPHCVYYNPTAPDALQVAGFLAIEEDSSLAKNFSLMAELTKYFAYPRQLFYP